MGDEKYNDLVEVLERSVVRYSDRKLFGVKTGASWDWITYGDFNKQVDAFRGGLASIGVKAGDRVAVIADNRVEWAVGCYATYGLRAAYVPMYQAQNAEEWEFIINDSESSVVLCATNEIYETVKGMIGQISLLKRVIGFELDESNPDSYAALLKAGEASPVPPQHPAPEETAGFIYTSGTTGKPKGVILSHGNITSNLNALQEVFIFDPEDRSLSFLPWAHSFGQTCELHGLISMGSSAGINDEIPHLIPNLAEVKPTVLFAVPRIFNRIYDGVNAQMREKPGFIQSLFARGIELAGKKNAGESIGPFGSWTLMWADKLIFSKIRQKFGGRLKYAISGSAALNKDVATFIDALGIMVYEGYGLTETSPIATANYPGARKIGSVGKAIPGVRIDIDKSVTNDPVMGEIVIYGPNIMQGYHHRPEENALVLMPDGGFRSGDMGYMDEEGFVYITGRIKEQYKLENGKYVVPSPLEEELKLSPYIANVMIHGANHPHNVALVVPDMEVLTKWAEECGCDISGGIDNNEHVQKLMHEELHKHTATFKGYEKPRSFMLVTEDFTTENGMLTPTLKLKRRNVLKKYEEKLEALFK
jgi:long-chain acyl-CoA synthetase